MKTTRATARSIRRTGPSGVGRRRFLAQTAAAFTIVPRHVLGGQGYKPPSETIALAFIGISKRLEPVTGYSYPICFTGHGAKAAQVSNIVAKCSAGYFISVRDGAYPSLGPKGGLAEEI